MALSYLNNAARSSGRNAFSFTQRNPGIRFWRWHRRFGLGLRLDGPALRRYTKDVPPPIRYVRSSDVSIAYQVVGDAPIDILMIPGWISHLSLDWEEPTWVRWVHRLTSFARLIRFDKRGTGLSDRPSGVPTLEERMRDALAVMDAVGLQRPHVLGWSEGGPL